MNYDSIDAHGLVLSPYSHGVGHEKGRAAYALCMLEESHSLAVVL